MTRNATSRALSERARPDRSRIPRFSTRLRAVLEDGDYPALVLDAEEDPDGEPGWARVELAITTGAHKGEVVAVRGRFDTGSPLDLLALPATLAVVDGEPTVTLDR